MRIRVTPENLREGADRLRYAKQDNDDLINQLDAIINGLVDGWHGQAQEAFMASYASKKPLL